MARMHLSEVKINIPFGIGGATWKPDEAETRAAWNLYVELVTRVATQDLVEHEGLDRAVLRSLYSLFPATRRVLRDAGPAMGVRRESLGGVAIAVLNRGLRPFLTKWHGRLTEWERNAKAGDTWPDKDEFRAELGKLGLELSRYAEALAIIAGVGDQL
jgi:hypothetical protein